MKISGKKRSKDSRFFEGFLRHPRESSLPEFAKSYLLRPADPFLVKIRILAAVLSAPMEVTG